MYCPQPHLSSIFRVTVLFFVNYAVSVTMNVFPLKTYNQIVEKVNLDESQTSIEKKNGTKPVHLNDAKDQDRTIQMHAIRRI